MSARTLTERLERWSDRLNPVLVKEVRQALRGNYFRYTFWATLSCATLLAVLMLTSQVVGGNADGQQFFNVLYGFLSVAALGLVPFFAFVAMGGEWEENTYDLLCLSDLRPRQIVLGKVLSSVVQMMLYYSAFGPFLVFAFLMQGVDLALVLFLLGQTVLVSIVLSTCAVALSTFSTQRYVRMFLQAALAAGLVVVTWISAQGGTMLSLSPSTVRDPEFVASMACLFLGVAWLGAFGFAAAMSRLAHGEENASTPGRVLTAFGVPLAVAGTTAILFFVPLASVDAGEIAFIFFLVAFFALFANSIVFCTERDELGRRGRLTVPRSPGRAVLAIPFLPGAGRGLVLYLVAGLSLIGALAVLRVLFGESPGDVLDRHAGAMLLVFTYGLTYLTWPRLLLGARTKPVAERALVAALLGAGAFVPTAVGFFAQAPAMRAGEHAGNPVFMLELVFRDPERIAEPETGSWLVLLLAAIGLFAHRRRILRGCGEVRRASLENAQRARQAQVEEALAADPAD